MHYLYIGLGGFLGAIVRFTLGQAVSKRSKGTFPTGTLIINLTGAFLLELFLGTPAFAHIFGNGLLLAITTGFLGAYTTFSTFSYEVVRLAEDGEIVNALAYLTGTLILGLLFALAGHALSGMLMQLTR
ncbi:MAG: fluoride efflux transporter CrcB [Moorella sp. (in: firmicutes)]